MATNDRKIFKKRITWVNWLGVVGLCLVAYQAVNIVLSLARYFNLALILYTLEILFMFILVQLCYYLLKR